MTCIDKKGLVSYIYKDFKIVIGLLCDIPIIIIKYIIIGLKKIRINIWDKNLHSIKRRIGLKPILLIHGYGGFNFQWFPISWLFLKKYDLYTVQIKYHSHSSLNNIIIDDKINKIYNETGMKVNLIGHSMGGIIASKYINHPNIDKIITIASPFRSSPLLKYFNFTNDCINDIDINSNFLKNLHLNIKKGNKFIHCFGGENDLYIPYPKYIPYNSYCLYNIKLAGHLNILLMPSLWEQINNII
jgi:pimeloyl-ACP methyl ester carboxylesterase